LRKNPLLFDVINPTNIADISYCLSFDVFINLVVDCTIPKFHLNFYMAIHRLKKVFSPRNIAICGISSNPNSVGGKILSNLFIHGFSGIIYPVNPGFQAVLGITCYKSLKDLPYKPDLGIICSPAKDAAYYLEQCGESGLDGVIIISSGFKESGDTGKKEEKKLVEIKNKYPEMRILGPNCLGYIVPGQKLNISFASGMPPKGNIAFISQSGALCASVMDWAIEKNIGFSYFVSVGNMLDIDFSDLIDFFGKDKNTNAIVLYIESLQDARKFMTATRAFARSKPIIACKAGRFPESLEAAMSHTGAMSSEDNIYSAAFKRTGLARVNDIAEIFDCVELLGRSKMPDGPNLGIITNAGGPGVLAVDALIGLKGNLAQLSKETLTELNNNLPDGWSHSNPVDVLGDARSKRIVKASEIVLKDQNVNALLVIITPQAMTNPERVAKAVGEMSSNHRKPVLTVWMGGKSMINGIEILKKYGIPVYNTPDQAVRAFMILVSYSDNLSMLYETPEEIPIDFSVNRQKFKNIFNSIVNVNGTTLPEHESKSVLNAYGIPVAKSKIAASSDEAVRYAKDTGFPVVLKTASPGFIHKSDVKGVMLDLKNPAMVKNAYNKIICNLDLINPDKKNATVSIQPMIKNEYALEMIAGIKKDPVFGTVIVIGAGGVHAELYKDISIGFPPLNERLVKHMLQSLQIWPILKGYRGSPKLNIKKLTEIIIRLSYLAADYPEIKELDINPLSVSVKNIYALDAGIIIDRNAINNPPEQYSHLALHPYPEKYIKSVTLSDGSQIILRPIKPEDEKSWIDFLNTCTKESLYSRFRSFISYGSHDVATRYCYIDYDREIAIVAEIKSGRKKKIIGVGRLISNENKNLVEFAILITDEWQNKNLGNILTDYCVEISKKWNMKKIIAYSFRSNNRLINMLDKRGFIIESIGNDSSVFIYKQLELKEC